MATRQQRVQAVGFTKREAKKHVRAIDKQVRTEKKESKR
jgi:hypothetical protein